MKQEDLVFFLPRDKPKKQDKGLIYLKLRIGKVDIVKLDLFKK